MTAETTENLYAQLNNACGDFENWYSKKMDMNGSKTELMLLNCLPTAIDVPTVKSVSSEVTPQTKSLGLTIADRLENKEHARSVVSKAIGNWKHFKSKCFPEVVTVITNPSLVIQKNNLTASVVRFPVYGDKKTRKIYKLFKTKSFDIYYAITSHHQFQQLNVSSV